jgi:hypothetical protein
MRAAQESLGGQFKAISVTLKLHERKNGRGGIGLRCGTPANRELVIRLI